MEPSSSLLVSNDENNSSGDEASEAVDDPVPDIQYVRSVQAVDERLYKVRSLDRRENEKGTAMKTKQESTFIR
ncbi:hypothetical protein HHI36_017881 [Cryptolaemus montrouzieri]|uniref:Uncharacterized protein n=1 Tax=Cryptolaemus montrouzieri TaxID=559131 RepID=A0ABD2NPG9_9CUCU